MNYEYIQVRGLQKVKEGMCQSQRILGIKLEFPIHIRISHLYANRPSETDYLNNYVS